MVGGQQQGQGGRLKQYNSGVPADTDSLQKLTYLYDWFGNVRTITDTVTGGVTNVQAFSYDSLDRLANASSSGGVGNYNEAYTYNPNTGNLASKGGSLQQTRSGLPASNPTSLQDLRYTFDAVGNVLTIQDYIRQPADADVHIRPDGSVEHCFSLRRHGREL